MSFLEVMGVSKRFGDVVALDDVSLSIREGSRTAIVRPSGSGKTTLLRAVAGFENPERGTVTLGGRRLSDLRPIVPTHRRDIGLVSQHGALFPHLTVADNIGFGLPRSTPGRDARIDALIETVQLDRRMKGRRPDQLSGGQQQRVALARALARNPRLMLLDEPFASLDTALRETMRHAVASILAAANVTTVLVTHDQVEAMSFADSVALMRSGRIVQVGEPSEIYLRPVDATAAAFLGDVAVFEGMAGNGAIECFLGTLPTDDPKASGRCRAMLRPEQIQLEIESKSGRSDPVRGVVVERRFAGSTCDLTIDVEQSESSRKTIATKWPSFDAPVLGQKVTLSVAGLAHIFNSGEAF